MLRGTWAGTASPVLPVVAEEEEEETDDWLPDELDAAVLVVLLFPGNERAAATDSPPVTARAPAAVQRVKRLIRRNPRSREVLSSIAGQCPESG